jgi:hypothetical protein
MSGSSAIQQGPDRVVVEQGLEVGRSALQGLPLLPRRALSPAHQAGVGLRLHRAGEQGCGQEGGEGG